MAKIVTLHYTYHIFLRAQLGDVEKGFRMSV